MRPARSSTLARLAKLLESRSSPDRTHIKANPPNPPHGLSIPPESRISKYKRFLQAAVQARPPPREPPPVRPAWSEDPREIVLQGPRLRTHPPILRPTSGAKIPDALAQYIKYSVVYRKRLRRPEPKLQEDQVLKMKCSIEFLTTPTADTPGTALVLHFDQRRYLIGNIAEGTQRACTQRKANLLKMKDIFLTGTVGWGSTGGLLGMILTIADAAASSRESSRLVALEKKKNKEVSPEHAGKGSTKDKGAAEADQPCLNINGGENLTHLLGTARRFIFRKGMPLLPNEFTAKKDKRRQDTGPAWQDEFIKVWPMVIEPETSSGSPRKRRHEEFSETEASEERDRENIEDTYTQQRQAVVSSMFNSDWGLDALFQKKLSEVQLPAAIFVLNADRKYEKYTGPTEVDGTNVPDIDVFVRTPWPGALISKLPPTKPSSGSVCYIIKTHPQRGKFNAKRAIALGVKPGPMFSLLTTGESVTTEKGDVVTPEMVMGPSKVGTGFAIVELGDASYIGPLLSREEWSSKEVMAGVGAVIWILGPGVAQNERLQTFMKERSEMEHIVSSQDSCPNYLALESSATAAIRLHLLDPDRFPIPKHSHNIAYQSDSPSPYQGAKPGLTLQLQPNLALRHDSVVQHLDTSEVVRETLENKDLVALVKAARDELMTPEYQQKLDERQKDLPGKDAEVVTLGTGSALPSKYRNVSATLLRVPGYGSYLFDCGENTIGQLKRVYGNELPQVLRDLKGIWISHLHADHHLGTVAVIKAWASETANHDTTINDSLFVISHETMIDFLSEYSGVEDFGYDRVKPIAIASSDRGYIYYNSKFSPDIQQKLGIASIQARSVDHCRNAAAVAFNFADGFKVAYSGDCRPSKDFIKIGQGATLLIHEATFDDELASDAYAKKHSTTSEALSVGQQMNARRVLLTHFSQRYQKIPVMDAQEASDQVALVAFDYMKVKVGDFAKINAFRPALMKLYEEEVTSTKAVDAEAANATDETGRN